MSAEQPLPQFEAFLDATPEKGVIVVESWWQPPSRLHAARRRSTASFPVGAKTSMAFFKRILVADKCWCGSGRAFGRCHRRADDWTFVTLDPDRRAYSPVVLVERSFLKVNPLHARRLFAADKRWLCVAWEDTHAAWALPAHPPIVNEIGQLVIGTVQVTERLIVLETNSEKRLEHLTRQLGQLLGTDLGDGETRRADPQNIVHPPWSRH